MRGSSVQFSVGLFILILSPLVSNTLQHHQGTGPQISAVCSVMWAVCSMQYVMCSDPCAVCSVQFAVYSVFYDV